MGMLFDTVQQIERVIATRRLEVFRTKGRIALEAGFSLSLIRPATPDDPGKLLALRQAAEQVLGGLRWDEADAKAEVVR